jgi:hypothetical protein
MNHTTNASDSDGRTEDAQSAPLANPRRIRIGADGRPVVGPVTTSGD